MARKPSDSNVKEFDETLRFCNLFITVERMLGEKAGDERARAYAHKLPDSWRNGDSTFSEAFEGIKMACRDFLEMSQDMPDTAVHVWDMMAKSQGVVTLSAMRFRHWKLVSKILNRGRILNDEEFYLVKGAVNVDQLSVSDIEREKLFHLLDAYEFET